MEDQSTLYLRIGRTLADGIRSGTLQRGERLPSVRALARQHAVSLATAVQAYRWLEDSRLVQARPRSGYFVAARTPALPEPETTQPPTESRAVDLGSLAAQVMRLAHEPGYLSFGAACPSSELFDEERVRRAVARAVQRHRRTLCEYPTHTGHETLRRSIARHALHMGCSLDARQVIVTNSCLESITLCLRATTRPGDVVALESPTYFGFLEILQNLHLRALEIPTHPRHGLSLDALQLAFETQPVKAVLAVPTLSNPLGACMPQAERRRLAQMVAAQGVPLIEDVLYNSLAEQDDKRRAVRSFDITGHVMLCGSFSKTVAPGLRLGWLDGGRWTEPLRRLKQATSGGHTTLLELALADLITQPGHESGHRQLRGTIAGRVDEARGLVARWFPRGTRVTDPPGGFILWVELPPAVDANALFHAALAEGICIAPGTHVQRQRSLPHCIRLGVGGRWGEGHRQALRRLGELAGGLLAAAAAEAAAGTTPATPDRVLTTEG
jgi:DNA-binding transcriptional MocR family regulator